MNSKPILMSGPMIRAILEGRKTQTRRVIKPQLPEYGYESVVPDLPVFFWKGHRFIAPYQLVAHCPYGQPGDSLWVRETWKPTLEGQGVAYYRADFDKAIDGPHVGWKPSIFMPRWASRITLEVTSVRVERVQDISGADAVSEGVTVYANSDLKRFDDAIGGARVASVAIEEAAITLFAELWDSLNGKLPGCSWQDNPWVWVVAFRRVDQ